MKPASRLIATLLAMPLSFAAVSAMAQTPSTFPNRPLKIIVATPAGGASDTAARLIAQAIGSSLGQQVVVENKPGANGVLALQAAQAAPPDGHTLLWAQASMAAIPMLMKNPPAKPIGEFTPISQVVNLTYGLFVNPSIPANSVAELTAFLKANPDKLNYATGPLGEYMVAAHYLKAVGAKAVRVPYKGGAQIMPDLISGQVQFNFGPLSAGIQHARANKLKLLAVLPSRSSTAPEVPSLAEAGIPAGNIPQWNGLMATPGTPRDIATRISAEVAQALKNPAMRTAFEAQGFQVVASTPQVMADAVESATVAWRNFVRDYDIPQE